MAVVEWNKIKNDGFVQSNLYYTDIRCAEMSTEALLAIMMSKEV